MHAIGAGESLGIVHNEETMESHEAILTWFGNSSQLEVLKSSIEIDDADSFEIVIKDNQMEIHVSSPSLRSLRSTVDDILACLSAAEATLNEIEE